MKQKNISYEKLAILTEIPERYIVALQNTEIKNLPAFPYVRGYLKKICEILGLNFAEIWKKYKNELSHKTSGAFDKLPANRFAIRKINRKKIAFGAVLAILIISLGINFNNFFGKPLLRIDNPSEALSTSQESSINLSGTINPADKLTINGKEVIAGNNGNFTFPYELQPGLNTVEFKVKKIMGGENSEVRQILFEATSTPSVPQF